MKLWMATVLIGVGATAITDLWGIARKYVLGVAAPNYAMVGRWVGHMRHGRFRHSAIAASAAIPGEKFLGWTIHYLIGIAFAALLVVVAGREWTASPTLVPALAVGVGTVAAPFLLMQPGMGAGFAATRTPKPRSAQLQSLFTHAVFGLGLYVSAVAVTTFS